MKILAKKRYDPQGSGDFWASRGTRPHTGVDYTIHPGDFILSPVEGVVTKLGYPYSTGYGGFYRQPETPYRYVQVTDSEGFDHRLFYVRPIVPIGTQVTTESPIGVAQDISLRYPSKTRPMTPHVHYEIIDQDGQFINPEDPEDVRIKK